MKKTIIVVAGDIHANSTVALCPPRFTLDDGGTYVASDKQRWLWRQWRAFWAEVAGAKIDHDAECYVIFNGELADDLNHRSTQLITRNISDQMRMAYKVIEQPLDIADHVIVTRGTEAHSGPSACLDEAIARDISAIPDEQSGNYSWWHFIGDIGGIRIDVSHHAGASYRRPSTKGGASNRIAADLFYSYAKRKIRWPALAWRGHTHRPGDSYDNHPVRTIVNPSWQLTNAFGHKLAGGGVSTLPVGASYAICNGDGTYEVHKRFFDWPIKRDIWNKSHLPKTN